jgi:hypothetical protein
LEFPIVSELLECCGDGSDSFIDGAVVFIGLFKCSPKGVEFLLFGYVGGGVIYGECSGKYFKFLELIVAILCGIFCVDFFEVVGVLFDFGDFFKDSCFAVDFFELFGLKVILALKFGDLGQFFV